MTEDKIILICGECKKIRTDDDTWSSNTQMSQGDSSVHYYYTACPDCKQNIIQKSEVKKNEP